VTSFFNKLFRKKISEELPSSNPDSSRESIEPVSNDPNIVQTERQAGSKSQIKAHLEVPQLIVGVAQSVGIQRDHNEDALFSLTTNLISGEKSINFGLYIIADGMGGHENGEVASNLAVEQLASHVINNLYLPLLSTPGNNMEFSIQEVIQAGVTRAHNLIKKEAVGGGTTLTAALILGDQMTITHAGDSRAYIIDPDGNLQLLTHDHSLVKRLEEIGQISPEQASTHPQRNILYRALGQGDPFESDTATFHLQKGSQLILCSDGLWNVIPENELVDIIQSSSEPQFGCQSLIQSANFAGGPDNISVIIVRIPE
jgi:protein phosphatase